MSHHNRTAQITINQVIKLEQIYKKLYTQELHHPVKDDEELVCMVNDISKLIDGVHDKLFKKDNVVTDQEVISTPRMFKVKFSSISINETN